MIHATAIVDSKAALDANVEVGPYSIIRQNVSIGAGTVIGPHVIIEPYVNIGQDCHIFQYAAIGATPQSLKFKGEKSDVKIGSGTIVREFVTIHRGTEFGGGLTEDLHFTEVDDVLALVLKEAKRCLQLGLHCVLPQRVPTLASDPEEAAVEVRQCQRYLGHACVNEK